MLHVKSVFQLKILHNYCTLYVMSKTKLYFYFNQSAWYTEYFQVVCHWDTENEGNFCNLVTMKTDQRYSLQFPKEIFIYKHEEGSCS